MVLIRENQLSKDMGIGNTLQDMIRCINLCVLKLNVKILINYDFISLIYFWSLQYIYIIHIYVYTLYIIMYIHKHIHKHACIPSRSKHKSYTSTVDFRLKYFKNLVKHMLVKLHKAKLQ